MAAYEPETGVGARLSYWYYGKMWRNDFPVESLPAAKRDYVMRKPSTSSLDLRLSWKLDPVLKVTLDVLNVLDKRNIGFAAPTPLVNRRGYVYSLQNPRTFYLGLEADWR